MLSDRHRLMKILLLCAALVGLCSWYSWQARRHDVGFGLCMTDPAANDGRVVELSLWLVEEVQADRYLISGLERGVPVLGPTAGLEPGATISVVASFDAERALLVEQWREVHHARSHKAALGLLGLLGFAVYAGMSFRFRDARLVLRTERRVLRG